MGRPNREKLDLQDIFPRIQNQMLSQFDLGALLVNPAVRGTATENHWIAFFNRYLPRRYAASSAFVISAGGRFSRQIDIAIYDRLYSPVLFRHDSGLHLPAESVYAVFEVKEVLDSHSLADAAEKVASVRMLPRNSGPLVPAVGMWPVIAHGQILGAILAVRSTWGGNFRRNAARDIGKLPPEQRLDFGCSLLHGSFEALPRGETYSLHFSPAREALAFLYVRLFERLRALGVAPATNLMDYARSLESLRDHPGTAPEKPAADPQE
jgi:hypothetical protein